MRKALPFFAAFLISLCASAQNKNGEISGTVVDAGGKPLPSVSASLLKNSDSSLVKAAVSSRDGKFIFENIAEGDYFITLTSVGFQKTNSKSFAVSASNAVVQVGTIAMAEEPKGLGGVTVTARRPFIETKIDKTVVNVEASPTNAGASALEVLEKSPGVMVNNDGAVSLRGKAGVIIMIDGKQTFLSSTDLAAMLKNMPASALDQIEIMTNPSAKYDASGNAGIINIKTKKGQAGGFNGSIMAGFTTGWFTQNGTLYVLPRSQNSINFNYRKNKINFFGNYNPNLNNGRSQLEIDRNVLNSSGQSIGRNEVDTRFKFGNNNHTLKLGLDYFANKKNTFGVVASGFVFSGHPTPQTVTNFYDANGQLNGSLISETDNRIKFKNLSTNFNYRHLFDSTGRELTVDLDYIAYDNVSNMQLSSLSYNESGQLTSSLLLQGHLPSRINIYSVRSDYTHPLRKGGRIEAGIKSSYVENDNLVDYQRWDGNKWVADNRSNHFIYDENINAAYVNFNKQIKKWSFQGGLRVENTIAKGYQVTNDSTFTRNFTNLFPTAFISYALNKSNALTVSFGRRINRPNYQDLNPFIYFLDSITFRKGNPFLLPQFTNNVELSYAYKGKYIATFNYNNTTDVLSQIVKPDPNDENILFLTSDNVARFRNIGLAITAPVPVAKWWTANIFLNVYNNRYQGLYDTIALDIAYTSFLINMTQTFTLKKGYTLEMSGFYRARGVDQLTINDPMYVVSFGGQKQVLKGKGTVRLNLRDPFWLQKYSGSTKYGPVDSKVKNKWDNRQVTVSFTYRFGKTSQQNQPPRRRSSASQDEQNRVGGGGQ